MSKIVGIVIVVIIVLFGLGLVFYCCESGGEGVLVIGKGCVFVFLDFIGWLGSFLLMDWGVYGVVW